MTDHTFKDIMEKCDFYDVDYVGDPLTPEVLCGHEKGRKHCSEISCPLMKTLKED